MDETRPTASSTRVATLALLVATLFWGCGFAWAKPAGETINHAMAAPPGDALTRALGPIWVLAMRFLIAAALWLVIFPDARRGWNWDALSRSLVLGTCLSAGMIVQHLGLDRTSEAVSAFLTSLTILFVPLMMTFVLRRPPPAAVWVGVVVAGAGVWLMTGASPSGFGIGEILGLLCAVLYSIDIIAIGALANPQNAAKITAGQFFVVGCITLTTCLLLPAGRASFSPHRVVEFMMSKQIGLNVMLLAVLASIGAFGLQFRFQPRIDPTRAALLYLVEPIFASLFAFVSRGSRMGMLAIAGAGLILAANLIVELLQARRARRGGEKPESEMVPSVID